MGLIPDRWLDYNPIGKALENVPLIAFKTPLSGQRYNRSEKTQEGAFVEKEDEFTPEQLHSKVTELGFELAVIIDLTFTFRYYDGLREFKEQFGVQYEKVKCEGQKVPNDLVFERMADIVNDVIYQHGKDGKKVVGIHCTHGVNRTGYLICRYLIEYLGYQPEDAIKAFNDSRGHDIERDGYIEDLKKRTPKNQYSDWEVNRKRYVRTSQPWNENIDQFHRDVHNGYYEMGRPRSNQGPNHTRFNGHRQNPYHHRERPSNSFRRSDRRDRNGYNGVKNDNQSDDTFYQDVLPCSNDFICETWNVDKYNETIEDSYSSTYRIDERTR